MDLHLSHVLGLEKTLDMTYLGTEGTTVYSRMPVTDAFRSRFGYQAGGATAGFIEHTGGRITEEILLDPYDYEAGLLPFGTHVSVRHCRSAIDGYLHGKAEVVEDDQNDRRRKITTKVSVTDDDGLLVSVGYVTNKIVARSYFEARRKEREAAEGPAGTPASLPFDAAAATAALAAAEESDRRYENVPLAFPCDDPDRRVGIRKTLGIAYSVETPERVEAAMPIDGRDIARYDFLAGGATLALLETAAGRLGTLHADSAAGEMTFGTNMDVRHRRSGVGGYLHAVATVRDIDENERRRKITCDVAAYDDDGNLLSEGTVENKIVTRAYWEARRAQQERDAKER